jgi:hypothetical protein
VKIVLNMIALSLVMFSCNKSFTREEMQEFIENPENGLSTAFSTQGENARVFFYPHQLLHGNELPEGTDSIDYFAFHYTGSQSPSMHSLYNSMLIVNGDSLALIDLIRLPNVSPVQRDVTTLMAFKSFLGERKVDDNNPILVIDDGSALRIAEFNIKSIQSISSAKITQ